MPAREERSTSASTLRRAVAGTFVVIAFATLALMGVANGGGSAASAAYQYTPFGGSATLTRDPSDASVLIFTVSVNDGSNEVNDVFLDLSSNSYTVTPID